MVANGELILPSNVCFQATLTNAEKAKNQFNLEENESDTAVKNWQYRY